MFCTKGSYMAIISCLCRVVTIMHPSMDIHKVLLIANLKVLPRQQSQIANKSLAASGSSPHHPLQERKISNLCQRFASIGNCLTFYHHFFFCMAVRDCMTSNASNSCFNSLWLLQDRVLKSHANVLASSACMTCLVQVRW